ncbi:unnamed protein product [Cunninghamella blakesleeana]
MPNGTRLQVGKYQVIIHNFIAEGGFAHVYLARIEGKSGYVVLKRVAVPDAERLKTVEKEIAFMRSLGDHKYIVRYYESRIDPLPIGGFEALILMEYCPGGGVIDLMNRRLQQRLTEPEILKIFSNVCEALAYMHYCNPPVLHRDLKVENILILSQDHYKLCDFGSAALSKGSYVPTTLQEIQKVEDDVQRHTTLQYRAPEMIDIYQKKPINEKADIWALGVLLYKLCYYTTPFEEQGQLAILNAHYTIPQTPYFSEGLRRLIAYMLQEDQQKRPNIYQVVKIVSDMMHVECPIRNIYQDTQSNPTSHHNTPDSSSRSDNSPSIFEKVPAQPQQLPNITPMRRGRPTRQENRLSGSPVPVSSTTSASSSSYDPFDPSHVKVQGDSNNSYDHHHHRRNLSSSSGTKFGFDSQFEINASSPKGSSNSSISNDNKMNNKNNDNNDDDDDYNASDSSYPWPLESQKLEPISIPPQSSTSSSRLGKSNGTKSISEFLERKRAPYENNYNSEEVNNNNINNSNNDLKTTNKSPSTPPSPPNISPLPSISAARAKFSEPISSSSSSISSPKSSSIDIQPIPQNNHNHPNNNEVPYRPTPPPKPARFRSKPSSANASMNNNEKDVHSSTSNDDIEMNRPPSISEFETKFPPVEGLIHQFSSSRID